MITLREGLLNKKNINTIDKHDFYLIFPFGLDQKSLDKDFSYCRFYKNWIYFIISRQRLESNYGPIQEYLSTLDYETAVWEINVYNREKIINLIEDIDGTNEETKNQISKLKHFKRIK